MLVGYFMHWLVPAIPLAAAFVLGAVVAPPDAVAATAVGRTLGLPRRILTILGGESLVNDATALTAYQVAVAAIGGGHVTFGAAAGIFLLAALGGVAVGLAVGRVLLALLRRLTDGILENTVSLLTPFIVYAIAEELHASGVLAVVVAGLTIGHHAPSTLSYVARLQSEAIWRMIDFVLESVVFLVIGLELTSAVQNVSGGVSTGQLIAWSAALLAAVIVIRLVWVYPATYLPRLIPAVGRADPSPAWTTRRRRGAAAGPYAEPRPGGLGTARG